jgi:hypothetical protein
MMYYESVSPYFFCTWRESPRQPCSEPTQASTRSEVAQACPPGNFTQVATFDQKLEDQAVALAQLAKHVLEQFACFHLVVWLCPVRSLVGDFKECRSVARPLQFPMIKEKLVGNISANCCQIGMKGVGIGQFLEFGIPKQFKEDLLYRVLDQIAGWAEQAIMRSQQERPQVPVQERPCLLVFSAAGQAVQEP